MHLLRKLIFNKQMMGVTPIQIQRVSAQQSGWASVKISNDVWFIEDHTQPGYSDVLLHRYRWLRQGFHPTHTSTPEGAYNAFCHDRRIALLRRSHHVLSDSHFWLSEPVVTWQRCSYLVSNPRLFGYDSYALSNCVMTAAHIFLHLICSVIYVI